jgi:transcriptional regulator with XRE-family HTH domain
MSQQTLAELIGTTQGRVSNWETGLRRPASFNAAKWAGVLGFDLAEDEVGRRTLVPRG